MIAAKEMAARLRRFPEVEAALTKAPIAMAREVEWTWNGTFYEALTPEQKKRVRPMLTSRIFDMNSIARALCRINPRL